MSSDSPPIVVVGAGLAGLSAAIDLAEAGRRTLLIERRPFAGGKAYSFRDPRSGVEFDNGQHIYLRCCTAYVGLLRKLGLQPQMREQDHLRVPVLDPESGITSAIEAAPGLPPPLHLAPSLLRYRHLGWRQKARLGRPIWAMLRMGDDGRRELDDVSFADWLRDQGQSVETVRSFWDLIVLPTCNDRSEAVSARQAILVFQLGLLRDSRAAEIGVAKVGLSTVAERALDCFEAAGGELRFGSTLNAIDHDGERVTGLALANGERIAAGGTVLALPPQHAQAVLPEAWQQRFSALDEFEVAPIVNVHLELDRPVLREPFVAVLDDALQYVFNRSLITGLNGPSQWLTCSLSGAYATAEQSQQRIVDATLAALRRAFPDAAEAELLRWRVVKELDATFLPRPGLAPYRLGPTTSIPNLLLAGAWTDTEWPATMESAVHSGQAAAAAVLRQS